MLLITFLFLIKPSREVLPKGLNIDKPQNHTGSKRIKNDVVEDDDVIEIVKLQAIQLNNNSNTEISSSNQFDLDRHHQRKKQFHINKLTETTQNNTNTLYPNQATNTRPNSNSRHNLNQNNNHQPTARI